MALFLDRKEVEPLLTLKDSIAAVEEAFRAMGNEPLLNHLRRRLHWTPGDARKLNIFAGSLPEAGYIGALVRFVLYQPAGQPKGPAIARRAIWPQ